MNINLMLQVRNVWMVPCKFFLLFFEQQYNSTVPDTIAIILTIINKKCQHAHTTYTHTGTQLKGLTQEKYWKNVG